MTEKEKTRHSMFGEMPSFDFTSMLGQYKMPGVDFAALVEREKRNIDALTKANKIAFEGWRALAMRQSEIMQETMKQTMAQAKKAGAAKEAADMARQGFEKALDHMRELAEMAAKSQQEAYEVVRKRIGENLEEMKPGKKDK